MKKRLHNKKAGFAILAALIIISLAEVVFRGVVIGEAVLTTANLGEQLVVIALAAFIMIMSAKGKDRICYICYGTWIGYFVLDQIFELPGTILNTIMLMAQSNWKINLGDFGLACTILAMVGIIALGALLLEYMNDGTIYNQAFNVVSLAVILLLLTNMMIPFDGVFNKGAHPAILLMSFNCLCRIAMVFLTTFFAYDSAKLQLQKVKFSK